ncbi:MAG: hypothetical protein M1813_001452 [Trichoglossum hirsutum]|nr:MAG: hypothetical protein M1813_001452 [Trichoglossum hirsutum]
MERRRYSPKERAYLEEDQEEEPESSMSSWLSRTVSSHRAQLAATAVVSGAVVAGAILGFQHAKRKSRVELLKRSIPELDEHDTNKLTEYGSASPTEIPDITSREDERSTALAVRARQGDYDDDLILEQLARNRVFLTDVGLSKLRNSFVIVVGCGGVGSHATAALARSGVSKIRLIDFDQVTLSSLNRHAVATLADVGTQKVQCLNKRLEQITPWVEFDCRNELFSTTTADHLLGSWEPSKQSPDYIIDAIDNIDSKVALLAYCHNHSLPVISSMGAGCKSDPTRIFIGDISTSTEDPLSRSTRRRLRAMGIERGIPVVYSTEKPGPGKAQLLPLPDEEFEKGKVGELGVLPDFRVRILPVLGTMPAVFGYTVANHVILEVTGYPHEYIPWKGREKMYEAILANLQGLEERLVVHAGEDTQGIRIPVTKEDVGYLVEEVYKGRSVISGLPTRLVLVRWKAPKGGIALDRRWQGQKNVRLELRELVCMTKDEAVTHEREILKGLFDPVDLYDMRVLELVEQRMKEEASFERFR